MNNDQMKKLREQIDELSIKIENSMAQKGNPTPVTESKKIDPEADYAAGYKYYVVDGQTKKIVGKYKSSEAASRAVDKRDNAYGAYRYRRLDIQLVLMGRAKEVSLNETADESDQVIMTPELLLRTMEWAKEAGGEDIQLHKYVESVMNIMSGKDCLNSDDYESIISQITANDPEISDDGPEDQITEAPAPGKKIKPLPSDHSAFYSKHFTGPNSRVPYEAYHQGIYDYYHDLECPYADTYDEDRELQNFWKMGFEDARNRGVSYYTDVVPEFKR